MQGIYKNIHSKAMPRLRKDFYIMSVQIATWTNKKGIQTRYYAVVWNPTTHKKVRGKNRKKKKDAVLDEAKIIKELASGSHSVTDHETFGRCAELWLETAPNLYRPSTLKTYKYYYPNYIKNVFEGLQIDHIQPLMIQRYVNTLSANYKPETVNKCINILSNIFKFAIQTLRVLAPTDNPMIGIKRLKVPYKKKETWTDEQISRFLNSPVIKANHYYPMFCVSLLLGCRPAEVCGLCDDDLINEYQEITIHRTLDKDGNTNDTKTTGSIRALYLPDKLYCIIKDTQTRKLQLKSYHPDYQHDFLFTTVKGRPVNPNRYSMYFRKALKEFNNKEVEPLPLIPLYNCRHSFATNNYERGESDKVLSDIMGNSPKTFIQSYAHIRRRQSDKAVIEYVQKIF